MTGFKRCATTPNNTQQRVQTDATCNIQQCWELLAKRCCIRLHGALNVILETRWHKTSWLLAWLSVIMRALIGQILLRTMANASAGNVTPAAPSYGVILLHFHSVKANQPFTYICDMLAGLTEKKKNDQNIKWFNFLRIFSKKI